VALTALSVLAGYLSFRGWVRRSAIFLLCFPLVYLGNVARLTVIVVAAELGGQGAGDIAHKVMGGGVFVIVLGGMLLGVMAIEKWWPEGEVSNVECAMQRSEVPHSTLGPRSSALVCAAVVTLAVGEMFFLHHLTVSPPRGKVGVSVAEDGRNPVALPQFLGTEWIGRRAEVTPIEIESLPPDTGFSRRNYVWVANPAKRVFLSIVLSGRDRTSIHRPEVCLVGQGWTIVGEARHAFEYPGRGAGAFPATVLHVRREVPVIGNGVARGAPVVVPELVVYWFVNGDRIVASHWERFAHDAWNRLFHARADRWAYVLMQTDASDGEAAALARMQAVLNETLPAFQRVGNREN
jgi:EpsI family protein